MTVYYHTDEGGGRKGCHPVSRGIVYRRKFEYQRLFSVDEPGTWWADEWNVHVDGMDFPAPSRDAAIKRGMEILGYGEFEILEAGGVLYPWERKKS